MRIYADNAATTKMSRTAIEAMLPYMENIYANPSSLHTLGQQAREELEKARENLMTLLSNYVAFTKTELLLVFDAYLVEENPGTEFMHDGYQVVFTKADQTADAYIEKVMHELGPDYSIRLVTGDKLLQFSAVHSGISRVTAKEFLEELTCIGNEITEFVRKLSQCKN